MHGCCPTWCIVWRVSKHSGSDTSAQNPVFHSSPLRYKTAVFSRQNSFPVVAGCGVMSRALAKIWDLLKFLQVYGLKHWLKVRLRWHDMTPVLLEPTMGSLTSKKKNNPNLLPVTSSQLPHFDDVTACVEFLVDGRLALVEYVYVISRCNSFNQHNKYPLGYIHWVPPQIDCKSILFTLCHHDEGGKKGGR